MDLGNLLPSNDNKIQRERALALTKKWERTGLLEGLKGYEKGNMAQLLETQAKQLVTEANATGTSQNSEEWAGIALPLVRRVFQEISAKEFVSVQPMNLPSGLVFWLDFKYGTGQAGFNTGAGKDSQNDSLFGITDSNKGTDRYPYGTNPTPAEGLYGPGRFGYSINDYTSSALTYLATPGASTFATGSVTGTHYNFNSEFSQSLLTPNHKIKRIIVSASALSAPDLKGIRAFTLTGTGLNDVYREFTKYDAATKRLTFVVSASATVTGIKVNYHKQPTDITRGDFEVGKTQQTPIDIPEINLEMRSEPIVAKTRKLKARWTPEFAQDINAYQNIDAEAELTSILGEYISQEIDFEILDMLIQDAQTTEYWSSRIGWEWNGSNAFDTAATNATAYNQGTWFQTLGTKMQKVSNRIHSLTMRGGANFAVVSPTVATILESIPGYAADTNGDKFKFAFGVQKIGMLNSRFQVYKNPYMIMTPLVLDPDTFEPRKGVMTRYAKKMLRPEYYGKIYVEGLNRI